VYKIKDMQHISATSLEDLPSRISYLSSFLELTPSDGEALLAAKPLIAPRMYNFSYPSFSLPTLEPPTHPLFKIPNI
jgi:hypothetical protein